MSKRGRMHQAEGQRRKRACLAVCLLACLLTGCAKTVSREQTDKGYAAAEQADYAGAQQSFEMALTEGEDPVSAYRGLGIALMGQARYREAVDAFNQALAQTDDKMPKTVMDLLLYREAAQYRGADYAGAIDTADTISGIDDKRKEPYFYRGAATLYQGDQDKAKSNFDNAVSLDPGDYQLYLNIYQVYSDNHLSGIGDEYLQTALGIEPKTLEDAYQVGQIYYYLEQYDQAAQALGEAVEKKDLSALSLMGRIYLAREDYENAKATYSQIQSIDPESADSYNGLALCALAQDDPQTALRYLTQGLALDSQEGKQDLYFNEIVAYERNLDFLTAKDKCQTYVNMYPTDERGQRELTFLNSRG